jgi:iron(III) transport system substrate-binding protein
MGDWKFSRRDTLKASTMLAAGIVFPETLKAAAPEPTPVSSTLIASARKEGMVAFYTAMDIPLAEQLGKAFEAKYPGIAVRVKRSGAERVFQRIGYEQDRGIYDVDIVCSTDAAHFVRWKRNGWLAPYMPEDVARHFPPEQIEADGMYEPVFCWLSTIGYNTKLVSPENAPKSFADLLDPKWMGKIVKGNPSYSGTILTATFEIARDLGWSYFEKLAQQSVMQVQSALEPPKMIALGERAIQADGVDSHLLLYRELGAPVEAVYATEGTPVISTSTGVFRNATNPNAARLFQSFLFSREAQQFLVDTGALYSFHALVKERPGRTPLSGIKLMKSDPEAVEAHTDETKARYSKIFGT